MAEACSRGLAALRFAFASNDEASETPPNIKKNKKVFFLYHVGASVAKFFQRPAREPGSFCCALVKDLHAFLSRIRTLRGVEPCGLQLTPRHFSPFALLAPYRHALLARFSRRACFLLSLLVPDLCASPPPAHNEH